MPITVGLSAAEVTLHIYLKDGVTRYNSIHEGIKLTLKHK